MKRDKNSIAVFYPLSRLQKRVRERERNKNRYK
jgi:hypothetical protein